MNITRARFASPRDTRVITTTAEFPPAWVDEHMTLWSHRTNRVVTEHLETAFLGMAPSAITHQIVARYAVTVCGRDVAAPLGSVYAGDLPSRMEMCPGCVGDVKEDR